MMKIFAWVKNIGTFVKQVEVIGTLALILLLLLLSLIWYYKHVTQNYNKQVQAQEQKITDLKNKLEAVTQAKVQYVRECYEAGHQIPCSQVTQEIITTHTGETATSTISPIIVVPEPETVKTAKKAYCMAVQKAGLEAQCVIHSRDIWCEKDICNDNDQGVIKVTAQGITDITHAIVPKPSLWNPNINVGYDFSGKNIILGCNIISYKGISFGADLGFNTKSIDKSVVGIFAGYVPTIGKLHMNIEPMIGIGTPFNNLFHQWQLQAGVAGILIEW